MAGLAGAAVAVETVLLATGQPLSLEPRDQFRRIDNAARAVRTPGQADDVARQAAQLSITALARFQGRVQVSASQYLGAQVVSQAGDKSLVE